MTRNCEFVDRYSFFGLIEYMLLTTLLQCNSENSKIKDSHCWIDSCTITCLLDKYKSEKRSSLFLVDIFLTHQQKINCMIWTADVDRVKVTKAWFLDAPIFLIHKTSFLIFYLHPLNYFAWFFASNVVNTLIILK